ncbi:hypothetical protein AA309_04585 [Microvirga vignae]|uniref:Uncharacterized protein n=1 Tax=Microvirga vignae TaxID=1225564 RepID=A0A0H1RNG9_9HYPH|nr:hypothetical protein [Microvirga vignae]KLK94237.1 hypothetical protein AA309_04585 [Microvirga vignae]
MDQPYSLWADLLSKFHTAPELIQALRLVMVPLTLLGLTWLALRGLTESLALISRRHWRGRLIDGVYQDEQGRWMIYRHGRKPQELDWANPPPELIGRVHVIRGVFRRPDE